MAYTITPTNGQNQIVIADGTINTSTTVTLVGKNYPNYGNILDQNFIRLLENSSNTTAPSNPLKGEIWWDSANNILKVYTGSVWKNVGSTTASSTQPTTNNIGDLWWKTDTGTLYGFDIGGNYKLVGPQNGLAGITAETLSDGASDYEVISFKVDDLYYMIFSTQQVSAFQPTPSIDGFQYIYPGLNLISPDFLTNARFIGEATNSRQLGGVYANSFLRSDINASTIGTISILNNTGLNVGTANNLNLAVNSPNVAITNTTSLGTMNFKVNSGSTVIDAVDIYPNGNLICNYDLVVAGTIKAGGSGDFVISTTTPSISTLTGALQVRGGAGIGGNINVGGSQSNFVGNVTVGNLVSNAGITASTITITSGTINATNLGGTISTAAQPNITSVGTLSSLTVSGALNASTTLGVTGASTLSGAVSHGSTSSFTGLATFNGGLTASGTVTLGAATSIKISGGAAQKFLTSDGTTCSWATVTVPTLVSAFTNDSGYYSAGNNVSFGTGAFSGAVSTGALTVTGALNVTGDITAFYTSDARLKTNIFNIDDALDKVSRLNGVTFEWNETGKSLFDEGFKIPELEVGVIAQEVQEVLPEVVTTRDNGMLAVNYEKIVPLLIEAIKELKTEIELLKSSK
jgi:hypothetical protein